MKKRPSSWSIRAWLLEIDGSLKAMSLWRARPRCRSAAAGSGSSRSRRRGAPRAPPPPGCRRRGRSAAVEGVVARALGAVHGDGIMPEGVRPGQSRSARGSRARLSAHAEPGSPNDGGSARSRLRLAAGAWQRRARRSPGSSRVPLRSRSWASSGTPGRRCSWPAAVALVAVARRDALRAATPPVRRSSPALFVAGAGPHLGLGLALREPAPGLGRRALLPPHGPEPLARPRPGPREQLRAARTTGSTRRDRSGPTTARRGATDGRTRPTAPDCPRSSRPSTRSEDARRASSCSRCWPRVAGRADAGAWPGAWADPTRRPSGLGGGARPTRPLLLLPRLHRGAVGPAPRAGLQPARCGAPGRRGAAARRCCASFLPWLHVKMVPPPRRSGVVAVVAPAGPAARGLLRRWPRRWRLALRGLLPARLRPSRRRSLSTAASPRTSRRRPVRALPGLLLDRSFGLLPHAPIFLLGARRVSGRSRPGGGRRWPRPAGRLCGPAPVLTWRMWWGGQCPPGRFLVPLRAHPRPLAWRFGAGRPAGPGALARAAPGLRLRPGRLHGRRSRSASCCSTAANRPTRVWAALSGDDAGRAATCRRSPCPIPRRRGWPRYGSSALLAVLALDRLARRSDRIDGWFRGWPLPVSCSVIAVAGGSGSRLGADEGAGSSADPPDARRRVVQFDSRSCQRSFSRTA